MILAVDIGNTNIVLGCIEGKEIVKIIFVKNKIINIVVK